MAQQLFGDLAQNAVRREAQSLLPGNDEPKASDNDVRNRKESTFGCFRWWWDGCKKQPCSGKGCIFFGWILMGIMAPILFSVYEAEQDDLINYGYILSCCLAILMSFCAGCLWQDVLKIREAIDDFEKEVKETEENAQRVRAEVIRLNKTHKKIVEIEEDLSSQNAELRLRKKQFAKWSNEIRGSTDESINASNKIKQTFQEKIKGYKRKIEQNEREILDKAYNHAQYHVDEQRGLNEEEFEKMMQILPQRYNTKLEKRGKTFNDFAGRDNYMDWDEFVNFMEEMIEQDVENGIDIPGDDESINDIIDT